jgi:hypothetical protein
MSTGLVLACLIGYPLSPTIVMALHWLLGNAAGAHFGPFWTRERWIVAAIAAVLMEAFAVLLITLSGHWPW